MELRRLFRGMSRIERIRVDANGALFASRSDAAWQSLELLQGSFVLSRMAWFRVRFSDGLEYGELLSGDACDDEWRRLQRVWRQRAAAFGEAAG